MEKQFVVCTDKTWDETDELTDCVAVVSAESAEQALERYLRKKVIYDTTFLRRLEQDLYQKILYADIDWENCKVSELQAKQHLSREVFEERMERCLGSRKYVEVYLEAIAQGGIFVEGALNSSVTEDFLYAAFLFTKGSKSYRVAELSSMIIE